MNRVDTDNTGTDLEKLEGQVDDMLKQLDDVLKLHAAPGAPHSDDEDLTGSGKDNTAGHQRPAKSHTQQVGKRADDDEDFIGKKKKVVAQDDSSDDSSDDGDGADDEGEGDDDWSEPSAKKRAPDDFDDIVTIEGQRIAKSDVGEAMFNILKSQSDKIAKANAEIKKARDEAEMATLRKRADDLYSHVPGTTDERASMLKSIGTMPEALRKSFEKVLMQSEKLSAQAFGKIGKSLAEIEDLGKSAKGFEHKVAEIQKRDSCSRTDALSKARTEDPEGFKAYQSAS